jgi:DNA-binding PadR family transcriptional regulator
MAKRELSRFEQALLGLVSEGAPCTAYWIRRQLQKSPSSFFSGSAGAVYPAIERLEQRALVKATVLEEGRRTSRQYRLTAEGRKALKAWLLPPFPPEDIAFTMDPVRTRVYNLAELSPEDRQRFVEEALMQARRRVTVVEAESEDRRASGDRFSYLGGLGVVYEAKARVRWLEELERGLGSDDD